MITFPSFRLEKRGFATASSNPKTLNAESVKNAENQTLPILRSFAISAFKF
jgi:hypothetical protein